MSLRDRLPKSVVTAGVLRLLAPALWLLAGPVSTASVAEEPPELSEPDIATRRVVEEILVTAQKAEQNIRDVPISMTVLDDEFIAERAITDYRDLSQYAPSARIDPGTGVFPDVNVRGFGSALSNKAFEQSVGLNIDGIPYGRTAYFQGPLFDLERVELLRGPQGTLFGKNTTAGLLNLVSKKPTDELTGFVHAELGELERRRFEAAIGGPIVPNVVNFRIAGLSDQRDGLLGNTTARVVPEANERMADRDRKGVRAQLGFPDLLGANLVVGYERAEFDYLGVGWEFILVPENVRAFYRQYDPRTDFDPDNLVGSVDLAEFNRNQSDTVVANASYDLAGWRLDAVGGYSLLKVAGLYDLDFGPSPMLFNPTSDDNPQTTAEIRATSPSLPGLLGLARFFGLDLGTTDLTLGLLYQRRGIDDDLVNLAFNLPVVAQFAAVNRAPAGTPVPDLSSFVGPAIQVGNLGILDTTGGIASTTMVFNQTTRSIAGFAQMDWHVIPRWTLQYGMRLTDESKEADWNRTVSQPSGSALLALGAEGFTASRSRSEFAFTPKVSLRHDWTDDVNFYASWTEGFKAGGFNAQAFNDNSADALQYAPEKATAWELGMRAWLLGGAAALNLALFRETIEDLQVLTVPPNSVDTSVVNAGKARAQGIELDAIWLPTSWLTLSGGLAFNDSEFLDFRFGQCSFDRPDTDGNGDGQCDVTGEPLTRTPKWMSTLVGSLRFPAESIASFVAPEQLVRGIDLIGGGTFQYQDVQYVDRALDERGRQSPFFRFGANAGFGSLEQGWSARVVVENLTDIDTAYLVRDAALGQGIFLRIPEPGRLVFGSFRWSF